mmetsp:Transcript_104946/g.157159  ORF Transcript_104946/g.157159 Transcript_104946/m.157159 type:complete len:267 (-) Transcript_104946:122-922(-)
MGNSPPRIKLHYVKEENRKVTGLVQFLDLQKGTTIPSVDIYIVGREKISYFDKIFFMAVKDDHCFYKQKISLKVEDGDNEPTFEIELPADLPPSGHGGNYKSGLGYAVGYHVLAEAGTNTEISDTADVTVALGAIAAPSGEVVTGSLKFCGRTLDYEIPKGMPRGATSDLKFRFSDTDGAAQNCRIRLREVGTLLKGSEQAKSEIKYEFDGEGIAPGPNWTVIKLPVSKYINTARQGKVLNIAHLLELTGIGTELADFINIPVTVA